MRQFASNDIISLVGNPPRYDLAESVGPNLRLGELFAPTDDPQLAALPLAYGTAQGEPRLRAAIAEIHNVGAEEVVVTVGGAHALFLLAFILCEPGDEAVTTSPLFPVARAGLEAVGATVRTLRLSFDRRYQPDLIELAGLLSERTRLVSLATPQNPSGVALATQTLTDILGLMRRKCPAAFLLVDETYREATYADMPDIPTAVKLDPQIVSVASLSKCHGAPGLRLGWAIARNVTLCEHLVRAKFNTVVSCSPLDEALALRVLARRTSILDLRRRHLAAGLALTEEWARRNRELIEWLRPDAGALSCVRLRANVFDDEAVSRFYEVLRHKNARVASGSWFGEEPRVFRLGFGLLETADLATGLSVVQEALREVASR
jgi:aspartate/methionine/tyrosine aminotransferase